MNHSGRPPSAEPGHDATLDAIVTISIDDGYPSDARAADLLNTLGYAATFYVPARNDEREVMDSSAVRRIADGFEMGAHGYNHRALPPLDQATARREIHDGREWLEDTISAPVTSFCYPRGKTNRRTVALVAEAGFAGARTTRGNVVSAPTDVFLAGATSQVFSHPRTIQVRHALLERNWAGATNYARIFRLATDWTDHFERGVSHVAARGGVAHLWFHSWELDDYDEWGRLEGLLARLKDGYDFRCLTNGEVFALQSPPSPDFSA
jgi:peptidoglycan/xylan/chitin deacetylase (PgdA/CDA1 family)